MNVTSPTSAPRQTPTAEAPSKTEVDYQSFLKLLVAQMKNQDPTNPMDSTQYVAQLAAFSQFEQSGRSTPSLTRFCNPRRSPRRIRLSDARLLRLTARSSARSRKSA